MYSVKELDLGFGKVYDDPHHCTTFDMMTCSPCNSTHTSSPGLNTLKIAGIVTAVELPASRTVLTYFDFIYLQYIL